jgi:hypothetical protein
MSAPDPECPLCGGTGMVRAGSTPPHPPSHRRCECVLHLDILQNAEKAYKGLSKAPVISTSPLLGRDAEDLWVTAGEEFLAHLRHVAIRKPSTWSLRVVSDAELTTAWLASIALQGKDILDADAYAVSTQFITIPDLVVPPDLLVIRMGVKAARNSAAPEVLAEALQTRTFEGKPTWLWDEPHHPLDTGHIFWSDLVERILRPWKKVDGLGKVESATTTSGMPGKRARKAGKPMRKTLRNIES